MPEKPQRVVFFNMILIQVHPEDTPFHVVGLCKLDKVTLALGTKCARGGIVYQKSIFFSQII